MSVDTMYTEVCVANTRTPIRSITEEKMDHIKEIIGFTREDIGVLRDEVSVVGKKQDSTNELLQANQSELIHIKNDILLIQKWQRLHDEIHEDQEEKKEKRKRNFWKAFITIITLGLGGVVTHYITNLINTEHK